MKWSRNVRAGLSMPALLLALLSTTASPALAQNSAQNSEHLSDGRLFARLLVGVGYGAWHQADTREGLSAQGFAVTGDAALGVQLLDDLSLHVNLFGVNAVGASVKQDSTKINTQASGLLIAGLGPGLTYHLPKLEMYLSFAAGLGWTLVAPLSAPAGFGQTGFGTEVLAGKEWWIRRGLAVGVAAQAVYVRVHSAGIDYNGFGGGLGANFTYR